MRPPLVRPWVSFASRVSFSVLSPPPGSRPGWFLCRRVLRWPAWLACCGLLFGWLAAWLLVWFRSPWASVGLGLGVRGSDLRRMASLLFNTHFCPICFYCQSAFTAPFTRKVRGLAPASFFLQQARPRLTNSSSHTEILYHMLLSCLVAHKPRSDCLSMWMYKLNPALSREPGPS